MRAPYVPLLLLAACANPCAGPSTLADYQAAREAALATPAPATEGWQPDAVLQISRPVVAHLIERGLAAHGHFDGPVETKAGTLTPDLTLDKVTVVPARACDDCLGVDLALSGTLSTEGMLKITVPLTVSAHAEVSVEAVPDGDEWVVRADIAEVSDLRLTLGKRLPAALQKVVDGPVSDAITRRLLDRTEPTEVTRFDDQALPALAVRVRTPDAALRVEVLTTALDPRPLPDLAVPGKGWTLHVQQPSLLSIARRETFKQGVVTWQVVPEPTGLDIGQGRFTLDLRLWMIQEPGWWRDYAVHGELVRKDGTFTLKATEVIERGASPGAAAADPLAELGRSTILTTITDSVAGSFADEVRAEGGALKLRVNVKEVVGEGELLRVKGDILARTPPTGNR